MRTSATGALLLPESAATDLEPGNSSAGAATSVATQLSLFHRVWSCDRQWQIPCWLASLLLHLLAIVLIGSLAIPVTRQQTVVALLLSFGEMAAEPDDRPEFLAALASQVTEDATDQQQSDDEVVDLATLPLSEPAHSEVQPPQRDESQPQVEEPTAQAGNLLGEVPPGQSDAPGGEATDFVAEAGNPEQDEVVDRFIQYDIGRLQGQEGVNARNDFQRLGPEAMASLVRGLNRSARIHASCPVMVITYKIEAVLRENHDPALLKYAIDHIGRDVPSTAPHIGRVKGLLAQLRRRAPDGSTLNLTIILSQLHGRDWQQFIKASEVVLASVDKFTESEKRAIAWEFIRLLNHGKAEVRDAAHQTLVALAGGEDLGPANDRRADDRLAAAGKWSAYFDDDRYEAAAAAVLKSGRNLQDAGKGEAARRYYTRVVREFPGTPAADEAESLLENGNVFSLK